MTGVETGLASHSPNMGAPRDFHPESEDGWITVTSKKTLHKLLKRQEKYFKGK